MAPSVVQSKKGYFSGNSATDSFDSAVTAGNTIVVTLHMYDANEGTTAISDTSSNSYTKQFWTTGGDGSLVLSFYYAANVAAGTPTITVNPGGSSTYCSYVIIELGGVETSSVVDVSDTNTGTGTSPSGGPITTTVAATVLIGGMTSMAGSNININPDGDYTQLQEYQDGANYMHMNVQARVLSSTATDTANWTIGSSLGWIGGVVAFKGSTTAPMSDVPPSIARRNAHLFVR